MNSSLHGVLFYVDLHWIEWSNILRILLQWSQMQ
jgi:hypothetical protein